MKDNELVAIGLACLTLVYCLEYIAAVFIIAMFKDRR